ncbi:MAG: hypothetical protein HOP33_17110 [Verrucomicrobia bacterium]|nr:hypothetical protein [Verrucomicrobiota bacterium]
MKRIAALLTVFCLCIADTFAAHTKVSLLLSVSTAKPGDTVFAAVRLQMDEGWHTYWKNPGGPGRATKIKWDLPKGITAGEIQWPTPEKLIPQKIGDDGNPVIGEFDFEQTTYVLHDEAVLLVPLTLASNLGSGSIELKAAVEWLECQIQCLPGKMNVSAKLEIGATTTPSSEATDITGWQTQLPKSADTLSPRATWEQATTGKTRPLIIEWTNAASVSAPDFFPDNGKGYEITHTTEVLSTNGNAIKLRKLVTISEGEWPGEIAGLLIQTTGDKPEGFATLIKIAESNEKPMPAATSSAAAKGGNSLAMYLLYAFLGGMILNIMPCVLPVIALKILGFVGQAKESPQLVRRLGLFYTAGVIVSFLALAALVIGLKTAGQSAGWGVQFSNPKFVIVFIVLVTLVALNLFGVFEVTFGGSALSAAGDLASKHGASGAFFNGVLATFLATPCTAPFLSIALGFAFAQSAVIIIMIFVASGAGLALPYLVLSWQPAWLKFLPKPGAWMEKFKIAMGFPMLATAVWLSKVGSEYYGERAWWLGIALVLVALAAWVFGEFIQRGRSRKPLALIVVIALLATAYFWALESNLEWRSPQRQSQQANAELRYAPKDYPWKAWSAEAVAQARAANRVVIVDFTAWWCGTCNTTVKPALGNKKVVARLKELNAVALLADNSDTPPAIVNELAKFGRAGVPMVLVYPVKGEPMVLPDPISPFPAQYASVILEALEKAN